MTPNKCKCGNHPHVAHITYYMWGHTLGYYVACDCGNQSMIKPTEEEAIAAWNEEEENECYKLTK